MMNDPNPSPSRIDPGANMKRIVGTLAAVVLVAMPVAAQVEAAAPPAPAAVEAPVAPVAPVGMRTYTLQGNSAVYVQVFKTGAAAAVAHDHVVQANDIKGSITADAADLTTAKIEAVVQTGTMTTDEPKQRARFKLEGELSQKDIDAVTKNMKSAEQLDVEKFPTITFASTAVKKDGDKLVVVGKFTLHGVTKEISVPVTFTMKDANTVEGRGTFKIQTPDYGIEAYSALFGAIKNKPEVIVTLKLIGKAN
jgi:polyisoprenoid-binding protein YceI